MTSKRTITATNETGFLQPLVKLILFVRLDFAGGVQRFHTEIGPLTATHPTHGAEVYTGIGDFGGISSEVKESVSGAPIGLKLSLTGLDATLINDTLTDDYFRREAEVMVGLEQSGVLIDDPEILFSGYMDSVIIIFQQNNGAITLGLESRGTNLQSASDLRYTDEDKQAASSGDLFAEYIYRMLDVSFVWGEDHFIAPSGIFQGGGGGGGGGGGDNNRADKE